VITTLAPVETRLAENPPSPRPQISAERGKETPARRRDLTAFIGEHDVPHGHKCIGNGDSYLASQVIVATSGKTECIIVCPIADTGSISIENSSAWVELSARDNCGPRSKNAL
jgi:hypothetical protein